MQPQGDAHHPDEQDHDERGCRTRRRRRRLAALGAAVGGVALLGSGALAAWQATTSASTGALSAAEVAVEMLDVNGGTFTASVGGLLPADWFYRYVDLRSTGTSATTVTGEVRAAGDLGGAMLAQVDSCSVPWTTLAGVSTCLGTTTSVAPETPLASPLALAFGTVGTAVADTRHVRYRFRLSPGAGQTLMGATGGITATVNGSAVGGRDRTGS